VIRYVYVLPFRPKEFNPITFFLLLACTTTLLHINQGMRVGEDVTGQVLSSYQYIEGVDTIPNYASFPIHEDLSQNSSGWNTRPPAASWMSLPGLLLGLSLGNSLKLSLFILLSCGGIGWLELTKQFKISSESIFLITLLLGSGVGPATTFFGTMNCALLCLVPWMILWAMHISRKLITNEGWTLSLISNQIGLSVCLGLFCLIKLSGMIASISILTIPVFYILFDNREINKKIQKTLFCIFCIFLALVFYKSIELFTEKERGISAHNMYKSIDYNQQAYLWGEYFMESTQGPMLVWSTLGAPGYALPSQKFAHGIRNFANQFESTMKWIDKKKLNPHALICGFIGIIFSILLSLNLWKIRKEMSYEFKVISIVFITVPFIGLGSVSFLHGFNYALYSSHTIEYALLLSLPVCHSLFLLKNKKQKTTVFLSGICIALPLTTSFASSLTTPFKNNKYHSSSTEKERGLEACEFSDAIQIIENDSQFDSDLLIFLPSGDLADLYLRTKLRTIGLNFSGEKLPKTKPYNTSKPLVVYCAYSKSLQENSEFQKALKICFPQSISSVEISDENNDVGILKINLEPNHGIVE
jgi:formate/nitrite transporter FocA (FNT family)